MMRKPAVLGVLGCAIIAFAGLAKAQEPAPAPAPQTERQASRQAYRAIANDCSAAQDEASCGAVTRDTMGEAPELSVIPTCEWRRMRNPGGPGFGLACAPAAPIQAIETCLRFDTAELCNTRDGTCSWSEEASACEPTPLSIAEYLPQMCATHSLDELSCIQALEGHCYYEDGVCAMNQAAVDGNLATSCEGWEPGSDCLLMGDSCPSFRERPTRPTFGCCRSALADSGQELCMTPNMMFDGHMDCMDQQDESPCMWAYKRNLCDNTNVQQACFPNLGNGGAQGGFRGNAGRQTSQVGGGRNASQLGNASQAGGGRGAARTVWPPPNMILPDTCSPQCDRALTAAKALGCIDTPELFGRRLSTITPEQWHTYRGICNCQNHPERTQNNASEHMACCDSITTNLNTIERLQHDNTDTCTAEEATSLADTLGTCQGERSFGNLVCNYDAICPASTDGLDASQGQICEKYITADINVRGTFFILGNAPSEAMLTTYALYILPDMLPGLEYKETDVTARMIGAGGAGFSIQVDIYCPGGTCPGSFIANPPTCRPVPLGNRTDTGPRFTCEGGPSLPEGATLPSGATNVVISETYINTVSHPLDWDRNQQAVCDDMMKDFRETGLIMCQMDDDGDFMMASNIQQGQIDRLQQRMRSMAQRTQGQQASTGRGGARGGAGVEAGAGGRGGGPRQNGTDAGGRGAGRRLQATGQRGGRGAAQAQVSRGNLNGVQCYETCANAIAPLVDQCTNYLGIARAFNQVCTAENVLPGGFDATCLAAADNLALVCGMHGPEDMLNGCSDECGAWAVPWWTRCRDTVGPLLDAESPGGSVMMDGWISNCPEPCADVIEQSVTETVVTAPLSEEEFAQLVGAVAGVDPSSITVTEAKHLATFTLSLPGRELDLSGATDFVYSIQTALSTALGLPAEQILVLHGTASSPAQLVVEVEIISGASMTAGVTVAAASIATAGDQVLATLSSAIGVAGREVSIGRMPVVESEFVYMMPEGVSAPDDIEMMVGIAASCLDAEPESMFLNWTELTPELQEGMSMAGWTQETWDSDACSTTDLDACMAAGAPANIMSMWAELTDAEQVGYGRMGWTELSWDCYIGSSALAAVVSVSRIIPEIVLRNDGSVCVNGFTCPEGAASGGGGGSCLGDLNTDGFVGVDDLLTILALFGRSC